MVSGAARRPFWTKNGPSTGSWRRSVSSSVPGSVWEPILAQIGPPDGTRVGPGGGAPGADQKMVQESDPKTDPKRAPNGAKKVTENHPGRPLGGPCSVLRRQRAPAGARGPRRDQHGPRIGPWTAPNEPREARDGTGRRPGAGSGAAFGRIPARKRDPRRHNLTPTDGAGICYVPAKNPQNARVCDSNARASATEGLASPA